MKIPSDVKWKTTGRTIGAGGQSQIYEVIDSTADPKHRYAMKVLAPNKPKQAYERFYREIEAIKNLDHPGIIKIVDHSLASADFHFYVMELIENAQTLDKVIESSQNPYYGNALRSLDLIIRILEVLIACESHDPRIVHRDLKPSNVLVLPDSSLRIIDFGICQIEGSSTITMIDEGVGSPNYMSPECESGAEGTSTIASDLYSVGKILWSAITGMRAFARENPVFDAKSMVTIFPDNPETWHLFHIFKSTIRKKPEDRLQTAGGCLLLANRVRDLIAKGYPPLELIKETCPICGVGKLSDFEGSHMVFGNPNPCGIRSFQCNYCGFCFAVNTAFANLEIDQRKRLE